MVQEKKFVQVKFLGVLKGLAKSEEITVQVDEAIILGELLQIVGEKLGREFKDRIFLGNKISPDLMIKYKESILPARNNEKLPIEVGSELVIFSFVHGG